MMPEHLFTQPLYLQRRDALAARISCGEWKPGVAIPSEARELGVSTGTMRTSLDLLEGVGLGNLVKCVSARSCSPSAAEALNTGLGTPVLILDRVIRTRDGRPAEWCRAECVLNGVHHQVNWG
jgi:DNA-binding GntR family transcriptional regulator